MSAVVSPAFCAAAAASSNFAGRGSANASIGSKIKTTAKVMMTRGGARKARECEAGSTPDVRRGYAKGLSMFYPMPGKRLRELLRRASPGQDLKMKSDRPTDGIVFDER